jgi:methyl-accepting chemotaxis protein
MDQPSGTKPQHKRHLRNYLLDSGYQLRFTLTMVIIAVALTSGLGYIVMSKAHEATRVVEVRALDPGDTIAQELKEQFAKNDDVMLQALIGFAVVLAGSLTAFGIVLTHKVAGPLHKVATYLDKMKEGHLGKVYDLRKGDELTVFFDHFKQAHDALRQRTQSDIELLDRAIEAVGSHPIAADLKQARERKFESLN